MAQELSPFVRGAVRKRTRRLQLAAAAVCGVPLILLVALGAGAAQGFLFVAVVFIAGLEARLRFALQGQLVRGRLAQPPKPWLALDWAFLRWLPVRLARVEYLREGTKYAFTILLFEREGFAVEGGCLTLLIPSENAWFGRLPVTLDDCDVDQNLAELSGDLPEPASYRPPSAGESPTDARMSVTATPGAPVADADRCTQCKGTLRLDDAHCAGCGATVSADQQAALRQLVEARRQERLDLRRRIQNKVKEASATIAALAILFLVGGLVMFFVVRSQSNKALRHLEGRAAASSFRLQEKTMTVEELRSALKKAPRQILIVNWILALIMGGLFLWSRTSPLPAVVVATVMFVTVQLVNLALDPRSVLQGLPIKIFASIALASGIRAALQQRTLSLRLSKGL